MTDETERPSFEFEGKRYERRSGDWFDVLTHMKAPAQVSRRIDGAIKNDRMLWERCGHQDFTDDPKNRGRMLLKRSDIVGDDLPNDFEEHPFQASPARAESGPKRRSRIGENVRRLLGTWVANSF